MQDIVKALYEVTELKLEHSISNDQVLFLLAKFNGITWAPLEPAQEVMLYQKSLIKSDGKVNERVFFRKRDPQQGVLDLNAASKPIGTDVTLDYAHKLERLVLAKWQTDDHRKAVADQFFKGDLTVARYFLIFRALFPVKDRTRNALWNKHFGMVYDEGSRWDTSVKVAKKFHKEIFLKKDIGIFLAGTYQWAKECTNADELTCFITKPYRYLNEIYEDFYEVAEEKINRKIADEKLVTPKIIKNNTLNKDIKGL